ncbi:glycosyltransferase [Turicibacter bilis]|uniref:Glycosyltransferase n=1 Tax=Turicibacter bilis TaxID=2735723 RepID=A0ABY5JK87_9FIRM|nr:glycosyltransferase [Turicibacter bilis]MBS3200950.1 glycosyltransferase [Turicibacter bilis]UUF07126.1 glycosyltransferase [Turicibacter bilis]
MYDYKVSIILPVYNVEKFLRKCLESLLNQTLDNIQIIAVNDGSTDNSLQILKEYEKKIIIINQENKGLSAARNAALKYVKGKYLAFVDSDDFMDKEMFSKMYYKAEQNQVPLVICDLLQYWDENKHQPFNKLQKDEERIYNKNELYQSLLTRELNCQVINKIYRTDIWQDNKIEFEEGIYYEDIHLSFKVIEYYKEAMFINKPLYVYRMNSDSITSNFSEKKINDYINECNKAKKHVLSHANCNEVTKYILNFDTIYGLYAKYMLRKNGESTNKNIILKKIYNNFFSHNRWDILINANLDYQTKFKFLLFLIGCY